MAYKINLRLPDDWKTNLDTYNDEVGETTHLEAHLPGAPGEVDRILIDVYVGDLPEGETAEDQAFANYAEAVGFDDDDENEECPIVKFKFNGRNAYGFEAVTEDNCPMRFFAQEVRKGVLLIVAYYTASEDLLLSAFELLERNLRIA
mgnify:CR=1 FL=1